MKKSRKLQSDCHAKDRSGTKAKTKTKTIIDELKKTDYQRKPIPIIQYGSVIIARTLIMARYGMLLCKANFSCGSKNRNCDKCGDLDNKDHRINHCILFRNINLYDSDTKIDYDMIYSNEIHTASKVVDVILKVWDLGSGRNAMCGTA